MRQRMPSSAAWVALILLGLVFQALACDTTSPVDVPATAVSLATPARFAVWWRLTEACSAASGDFASVSWYVVPHTTTLTYQGQQVNAYWIGGPDRIVLADAYRYDGPTVRHEMLHVLLQRSGHPRSAFLTACGGVVACQGACASETGGYLMPSAAAPELQPRDLGTRVEVIGPLPAEVLDSGAVAVMISIANPRSEPVWVRLKPRSPEDLRYRTFGLVVDYDDPARIAESSADSARAELIPLGASETRHWVWNGTLGRGRFGFLGFFNADSAARQVISVGQ